MNNTFDGEKGIGRTLDISTRSTTENTAVGASEHSLSILHSALRVAVCQIR